MRIVFMGTPAFSVPSLVALAARHDVVAVYTRPDSRSGRGRKTAEPPVKRAATAGGLEVRQPGRIDDAEVARVRDDRPDVICVAAYGLLLPGSVLDVPAFGAVNVHASLLPRHRGAAPIERAILQGDETTGVSIMRMEETLDTGPVALTAATAVAEKDVAALTAELAELGADALLRSLDAVAAGTVRWTRQDDSLATYAAKIGPADVALDPTLSRDDALRRVRASSGRAAARLTLCGSSVAVVAARTVDDPLAAGEARYAKDGPVLGFADGALRVERMRPESRGEMSGAAFVCGMQGPGEVSWDGPPGV